MNEKYKLYEQGGDIVKGYVKYHNDDEQNVEYDFYNLFLKNKKIADTKSQSGTLTAFSVESPAAVKKIAEAAKANGGDYFSVDMGIPEEQMFSLEVMDLDGNQFEPVWMSIN